jgi:hypothetical protein
MGGQKFNMDEKILTFYRSGKNLNLKAENAPITYQTVVTMCSAIIEDFIKQIPDSKQIGIEDKIYNDINKVRKFRHMLAIEHEK